MSEAVNPNRPGLREQYGTAKHRRPATAVYFILAPGADRIKIGSAGDPYLRLEQLQTGCPEDLVMLGTMAHQSAGIFETVLHDKFAHLRARGEWFTAAAELRDYITANAEAPPDDGYPPLERVVEVVRVFPKPHLPKGTPAPKGNSRAAVLARYKLARGIK